MTAKVVRLLDDFDMFGKLNCGRQGSLIYREKLANVHWKKYTLIIKRIRLSFDGTQFWFNAIRDALALHDFCLSEVQDGHVLKKKSIYKVWMIEKQK